MCGRGFTGMAFVLMTITKLAAGAWGKTFFPGIDDT
jgi:hypothetical protein